MPLFLDILHGDVLVGAGAEFEATGEALERIDHDVGVGAAAGVGGGDLSHLVLVDGEAVVAHDALAGSDDAVAFLSLIDHGDIGDKDVAIGFFDDETF